MALHVVILAAGQGKRMRSALPKVLQPLGARPMLAHVIDTAQQLQPAAVHVVHGHGGERVRAALECGGVNWVEQAEQLGTGHAVNQAMAEIPDDVQVLVLYGDVPLIRPQTLNQLVAAGQQADALALLTVVMADPTGYGRVCRDADHQVVSVVEDKDASADQRRINEVNTGLLCAPSGKLRDWLSRLNNDNAQGEYYLTDCIGMAAAESVPVVATQPAMADEVHGINDRPALAAAERILQRRQADELMAQGLMLKDPQRFDLRGRLHVGRDCVVDVNCVFEGDVTLGDDVVIGPNCCLKDCHLDAGTQVLANSVIDGAEVGRDCRIGPFARLRPATQLADRAKVGNFVETKKASVGVGSKINHLSYVGDSRVGRDVNIGAGVITCNYDGVRKHVTEIGDGAFIGSDVQLVAPVEVGAGATIGAGSTITRPAPEHKLTLSRSQQFTVANWIRPQQSDERD